MVNRYQFQLTSVIDLVLLETRVNKLPKRKRITKNRGRTWKLWPKQIGLFSEGSTFMVYRLRKLELCEISATKQHRLLQHLLEFQIEDCPRVLHYLVHLPRLNNLALTSLDSTLSIYKFLKAYYRRHPAIDHQGSELAKIKDQNLLHL